MTQRASDVDLPPVERAKRAAALQAVTLIEDGMIVGLGSGSTSAYFVQGLAQRVASGLRIVGVPTSNATASLAASLNIPLTDLETRPVLDIDVDGADEIDERLRVLKGGGGAMLHEKIVALASKRFIVIADDSKLVRELGGRPIPVEVVAFGWVTTKRRLEDAGMAAEVRGGEGHPYVTDSGNMILDVLPRPEIHILDLANEIKALTGVLDHGIFPDIVEAAFIGYPDGHVKRRTS